MAAVFGYIQHFPVLMSKSIVIMAEYCSSVSISTADCIYEKKSSLLYPKLIQFLDICDVFSCICIIRGLHKQISGKFLLFHAEIGWQAQFFCICPNASPKPQSEVSQPMTASPASTGLYN